MNREWYWAALITYSVLMVVIGVITRTSAQRLRRASSEHLEFWIAQRQLPGWWLAVSLTAGWLMLGWLSYGMAQVYKYGATGLWILPIPWFILCFIIVAMAPLVRRIGAVSLPEAFHKRYGLSARALLAGLSFFVFILWTQAELFIGGQIISPFLGLQDSPWLVVALLVLPVMIYMCLGGFRAVVFTDVVQFGFMAVFMIILAAVAVGAAHRASAGDILGALAQATPPAGAKGDVFSLGSLGWVFPLVLLLGFLPGWMVEQDLTLRLQAARTTRDARRASLLALVLITVFILVLPSLVAFCAIVAFPPTGTMPARQLGSDATNIVAAFITTMHPALSVFMILGVIACQMSTVDTFANVSAMPLAYDIFVPGVLKGRPSARMRVRIGQLATLVALIVAALLAMISRSLGDVYNISSGVLSACIAVPALFVFWKRTTLPAVLSAAIAGFVGTVGMYFLENKAVAAWFVLPKWLQASAGYNYVATGVVLSIGTIVLVSLITPKPPRAALESVRPAPVDDWEEFTAGLPGQPLQRAKEPLEIVPGSGVGV
ncbi:MAG: sodium:solute symporter family protein [Phycisphaerae bacterium]|nr:sodium:solute symporter family protein [Phycisphaerae bacterium]